jgi:hypothetical protein
LLDNDVQGHPGRAGRPLHRGRHLLPRVNPSPDGLTAVVRHGL